MNIPKRTQVLVMGGGPGGATTATLLAQAGFQVTLCERSPFPRYHIGESLLPSLLALLRLLGVKEQVEAAGFPRKEGALVAWDGEQWLFDWSKNIYSYQVDRAQFDRILLENAAQQGVQVYQGVTIGELRFQADRPVAATWASLTGDAQGEIAFDYLVDASGRAGLMATRYLQSRQFLHAFQNVALWGYWQDAKVPEVGFRGPITAVAFADGWIWAIPQPDQRMSVGVVMHKETMKAKRRGATLVEIYQEGLNAAPLMQEILASAQLEADLRSETDYSYLSRQLAGPGFFLVGDAACFIDPLLSSGVHLAMYSGLLAAASLGSILRGEVTERAATAFYQKSYRGNFLRWLTLVSSFYGTHRVGETGFWQAQKLSPQDLALFDEQEVRQTIAEMALELRLPGDDLAAPAPSPRARPLQACFDDYQRRYITQFYAAAKADKTTPHGYLQDIRFAIANDVVGLRSPSAVDGLFMVLTPHLGLATTKAQNGS